MADGPGAISLVGLLGGECFGAAARRALAEATVARRRAPPSGRPAGRPSRPARGARTAPSDELLDRGRAPRDTGEKVCVVVSGDPGFFGLARLARARFGARSVIVHPAPSSVALACARAGAGLGRRRGGVRPRPAAGCRRRGHPGPREGGGALTLARTTRRQSRSVGPCSPAGGPGPGRDRRQPAGRTGRAGVAAGDHRHGLAGGPVRSACPWWSCAAPATGRRAGRRAGLGVGAARGRLPRTATA